jgi:hypothetical protein
MKIHPLVSSSFMCIDRQNRQRELQRCSVGLQKRCTDKLQTRKSKWNNQEYAVTSKIPEVDEDVPVVSSFEQGVHSGHCVVSSDGSVTSGHCVVISGQVINGGHEHGNIVDSVAQVTCGHVVVVSIGQSVTFSVVQGGHTVVDSVVQGGHTVVGSVAQGGHTVVASVVQSGHTVVASVVQGGHAVVGSVVHTKASVVPAGKTVFLFPYLPSLFSRLQVFQLHFFLKQLTVHLGFTGAIRGLLFIYTNILP